MDREYWTELDGTNGLYDISNFGNIRNAHIRRNLTPRLKNSKTQKSVLISLHNKSFGELKISIAREVYKHFSKEPIRYKGFKVFHKDGNIWNNHIDNLYVLNHIKNKESPEQLEIFNKEAYKNVRAIVYSKYNIKGLDKEDLIQEAILLIYKYLPNFDINKNFFKFCCRYVKYALYSNYKQLKELCLFNEFQEKLYN